MNWYCFLLSLDDVIVYKNKDIRLDCGTKPSNQALGILLWKKDKTIFSIGNTFVDHKKRISLEGYTLVIRNVTESDAGLYTDLAHVYRVTLYSK